MATRYAFDAAEEEAAGGNDDVLLPPPEAARQVCVFVLALARRCAYVCVRPDRSGLPPFLVLV